MKKILFLLLCFILFSCSDKHTTIEKESVNGENEKVEEYSVVDGFYLFDGDFEKLKTENPDISKDDIETVDIKVATAGGILFIEISFTEEGAKKIAETTKENRGKLLAIVVDGKLVTAPKIAEPILGGKVIITGNYSFEEAKEISEKLKN